MSGPAERCNKVVKLGEKFEVIATNIMDDQMFIASPVVAAGDLLLRSQDQLFCISQSPLK
jgi:hypothetical protein